MYERFSMHYRSSECQSSLMGMESRRCLGRTCDDYEIGNISTVTMGVRDSGRLWKCGFSEWNRIKRENQGIFFYFHTIYNLNSGIKINEARCFKDFNQFKDAVIKDMDIYRKANPLKEIPVETSPPSASGTITLTPEEIQGMYGTTNGGSSGNVGVRGTTNSHVFIDEMGQQHPYGEGVVQNIQQAHQIVGDLYQIYGQVQPNQVPTVQG